MGKNPNKCVLKPKVRQKFNKKWEKTEEIIMLKYIQEHRNLEKPTAQIYYRKLLESTYIKTTWQSVRWKMRYLKENFKKAKDWKNKTSVGITDENGMKNIEEKLKQICPHFDILLDIFGDKDINSFESSETEIVISNENSLMTNTDVAEIPEDIIKVETDIGGFNNEECVTQVIEEAEISSENSKTDRFVEKTKLAAPKTAIDQLNLINKERNEILRLKLEAEKEYNNKKLHLEHRRFEEEIELRKKELELKKLELEKDERLKMYEIKMKYMTVVAMNSHTSPDAPNLKIDMQDVE